MDPPGAGDDELTLFGEPSGSAIDEGCAEFALEACHVGRHIGLDGVERLGRSRERARLGHRDEGGELAEVHRRQ